MESLSFSRVASGLGRWANTKPYIPKHYTQSMRVRAGSAEAASQQERRECSAGGVCLIVFRGLGFKGFQGLGFVFARQGFPVEVTPT